MREIFTGRQINIGHPRSVAIRATLNTHVAESRKRANKNYNLSTLTNALTTKHKILDIKGGLDKGLCYTYVQLANR